MKNIRLSVVTENQTRPEKAERIAALILDRLKITTTCTPEIEPYFKFESSYRIVLVFPVPDPDNSIVDSIRQTSRLCTPWTVYLNDTEDEVSLIFNKTSESSYASEGLNTIWWAHWEICDQ